MVLLKYIQFATKQLNKSWVLVYAMGSDGIWGKTTLNVMKWS